MMQFAASYQATGYVGRLWLCAFAAIIWCAAADMRPRPPRIDRAWQ
jgi:hypothetical protein